MDVFILQCLCSAVCIKSVPGNTNTPQNLAFLEPTLPSFEDFLTRNNAVV